MQLQLQTFTSLVQKMAAAVQSAATQLLDLTVGSALRSVLEANASIALWMQWLILQVLQTTRAATCSNADLDSWMNDFSLPRLPAVSASGTATFSRHTPTLPAFIPVGALVRTADGAQIFVVTASAASPAFDPVRNGYALPAGTAALDAPIQAQISGVAGNLQAATISLLATAIPGVDSVTNAQPFQNGLDKEPDDAFRVRFSAFIDSRSRATPLAIGSAIRNIQQGLGYAIQENIDPTGAPRFGNFVVTVDDGSGAPSASLLTAVTAAVDAVRPVGSIFTVQPPTILLADISLSISVGPGGSHTAATVAAAATIVRFVNGLPIGTALPLTKIAQLAYAADAAITNVSELKINTVAADLIPPVTGLVRSGTVIVN